jgi:hypothetical protein
MFYGWLLAENFTVLGYSLNTEKTMRGANSVPTYTGVPGGVAKKPHSAIRPRCYTYVRM